MKVNLTFPLITVQGEELKENKKIVRACDAVATYIANQLDEKDGLKIMKYWRWAEKFAQGQTVEMDESDIKMLQESIEKSGISIFVKAQVIEILDKCLEKEKKEK